MMGRVMSVSGDYAARPFPTNDQPAERFVAQSRGDHPPVFGAARLGNLEGALRVRDDGREQPFVAKLVGLLVVHRRARNRFARLVHNVAGELFRGGLRLVVGSPRL